MCVRVMRPADRSAHVLWLRCHLITQTMDTSEPILPWKTEKNREMAYVSFAFLAQEEMIMAWKQPHCRRPLSTDPSKAPFKQPSKHGEKGIEHWRLCFDREEKTTCFHRAMFQIRGSRLLSGLVTRGNPNADQRNGHHRPLLGAKCSQTAIGAEVIQPHASNIHPGSSSFI